MRSRPGCKPTDAQLQQYYAANRARYMIPEQRALRIARIGPEQVAGVAASDQEVTAYYNAEQGDLRAERHALAEPGRGPGPGDRERDRTARQGRRNARRRGRAGGRQRRGDHAQRPEPRRLMRALPATRPPMRCSPPRTGAIVGPIQSDFGWVVVKVDAVKAGGGKTLEQAQGRNRGQAQRRQAQGRDRGSGRQGPDRARRRQQLHRGGGAAKLPVTTTPLITANGTSRADPAYKLPPELAPALKSGFEIAPNDPPEIVVAAGRRRLCGRLAGAGRSGAPAPLASIRDRRSRATGSTTRRCSAPAPRRRRSRPRRAGSVARRCGEERSASPSRRRGRSPRGESRSPMRKATFRRR